MVESSFDRTLFDLDPLGFVPSGGRSRLHSAVVCLYLSQVSVAALEKVPLISISPTSTASRPQAGSMIFVLQACMRSRALDRDCDVGLGPKLVGSAPSELEHQMLRKTLLTSRALLVGRAN